MRNDNKIGRLFTSSLSLRIVLWVFFSVIVIEAIILIPSLMKRENELLSQLEEITAVELSLIFQLADSSTTDEELFEKIKLLQSYHKIKGGALYQYDGNIIGAFGEKPELTIAEIRKDNDAYRLQRQISRYDVGAMVERQQTKYVFIVRIDSSEVKQELYAFVWRIAGLVFIISIFVTAGAWLALKPIVVSPILRLRNDLIKAGDAISKDQKPPPFYSTTVIRRDELGDVITAFNHMFGQISDAIRQRKEVERELRISYQQLEAFSAFLNTELEKGRQIQKNFFPNRSPLVQGWEISTYFKEARQLSGDFYDVFELPSGRLGFVVADVCDKGVGAALFMALFRSLIRVFSNYADAENNIEKAAPETGGRIFSNSNDSSLNSIPPGALKAVELTNDYVAMNHGELVMFATLFFGFLDPATGSLHYINAGHEPLVMVNSYGGIKALLEPTAPAVGFDTAARFGYEHIQMEPGSILLGYTDGVPDAINEAGEFYTVEKLFSLLEQPVATAPSLMNRIVTAVESHIGEAEQHDDITLMVISRKSS
jgi:sigma-B regulation protein RsbU (phosphoserine phosphatase)